MAEYANLNTGVCMLFNEDCTTSNGSAGWFNSPQLTTRLTVKPKPGKKNIQLNGHTLMYIGEDDNVYVYGQFYAAPGGNTIIRLATPEQITIGSAKPVQVHMNVNSQSAYILDEDGRVWMAGRRTSLAHYGAPTTGYGLIGVEVPLANNYIDIIDYTGKGVMSKMIGITTTGDLNIWSTTVGSELPVSDPGSTKAGNGINFVKIAGGMNRQWVLIDDAGGAWSYTTLVSGTSDTFLPINFDIEYSSLANEGTGIDKFPWPWTTCSNSTYVPDSGQ